MDHANIYVFIAATYTPLALILLDGTSRVILLFLVWAAALGGLFFRLFWLSAPRWLYTALYIVMGWAAVGWLGSLHQAAGAAVRALDHCWRRLLHPGRSGLRPKASQPLPHLVRFSRDLPRRHHRWLRLPLRGNRHDHDLVELMLAAAAIGRLQLVGQVIDGGDRQPAHKVPANVCRGQVIDHGPISQQREARLVGHASHHD